MGYPDGRLPDSWPIKEQGCILCNSSETLPCGTPYSAIFDGFETD
jgi:hypothetical protein